MSFPCPKVGYGIRFLEGKSRVQSLQMMISSPQRRRLRWVSTENRWEFVNSKGASQDGETSMLSLRVNFFVTGRKKRIWKFTLTHRFKVFLTFQGTNISPKLQARLKMLFLFQRWDVLVYWRVTLILTMGVSVWIGWRMWLQSCGFLRW